MNICWLQEGTTVICISSCFRWYGSFGSSSHVDPGLVRSGHFGLGRFSQITGVDCFGPISGVGCFGPLYFIQFLGTRNLMASPMDRLHFK